MGRFAKNTQSYSMPEAIIIPVIYTEDTSGLEKALAETTKLQKATSDMASAQQKAFSEGAAETKKFTDSLADTGAEMADLEATTKQTNTQTGAFRSLISENIRGLSLFGHNLGDVVDNLKAKQVALRGVMAGLGGASNALKLFKVALISTGIGAIVVLLGSLVAWLTKTEAGMNKVAQVMAAFRAIGNVLIKNLIDIGRQTKEAFERFQESYPIVNRLISGLGSLVKVVFEVSTGIALLKNLFPEMASEMREAAKQAMALEAASQRLADSERELAVETSKRRAEIEKNKELADDETKSYTTRIDAAKKASEEEQRIKREQIKLAEEALRIVKEQNKLEVEPDKDAEAQAVIRLNELKADGAKQERLDLNRTQALLRQQQRELKALADEERKRNMQRLEIERKQLEAFNERQRQLAKQINDEVQLASTEAERLEFQRQNAIESLNIAEQELIARAKQVGQLEEIAKIEKDFATLRGLTNERYQKEITKVVEEEVQKQTDALEKGTGEYLQKQNEIRQSRLKFIDEQRQLDEMRIDAIKQSGDDELSLEQFKEDAKLRLLRDSLGKQRKAIIETDTTGQGASLFDVQKIDAEISAIDDQLMKLEALPVLDRIKNKIKNLFNLDDEDLQQISEQVAGIYENIFSGLSALNDAELSQQEKIIAARQEAIQTLRGQLDEELRLKQQGFANNSTALQEQLKAETELLKKEEEKRLALEKKAAQLRLRQEALQTASNIALSVTKVIAAESGKGILGIITAVSAVASIFALIAKSKAQAAQFSQVPKLRHGGDLGELFEGKVVGASHEGGGVPAWLTRQQRPVELEGNEFVMPVAQASQHGDFLEQMRGGAFDGKDVGKYYSFGEAAHERPTDFLSQLPQLPNYSNEHLPAIRKLVMENQKWVVSQSNRTAVEVKALRGEMGDLKRAILEKPDYIPLTEMGYMKVHEVGNTKNINIYAPPKSKDPNK